MCIVGANPVSNTSGSLQLKQASLIAPAVREPIQQLVAWKVHEVEVGDRQWSTAEMQMPMVASNQVKPTQASCPWNYGTNSMASMFCKLPQRGLRHAELMSLFRHSRGGNLDGRWPGTEVG
jgi:hypothetical protein